MWPEPGGTYIPADLAAWEPPSIAEVRERGQIVLTNAERTRATVQITSGLVVFYCAVTLNPDGTIGDFVPRPINRYARITPMKED